MKLQTMCVLGVALLLFSETLGNSAQPDADQEAAIAEIKKLGGHVTVGNEGVVAVHLSHPKVTDAGLESLKGVTNLRTLNLGYTQVSDAGLEHIKGLTDLESLRLSGTQVTDAGVKKLRQALPNCKIRR